MGILIRYNITILFFILTVSVASAEQNLKFLNIDEIIKKTKIGSQMLNKINNIDNLNVEKLKSFEEELKTIENELNSKKNIISSDEFEKELELLKKKIEEYNKKKNLMSKELKITKNNELKIFFDQVNPIIQNYMNNNSIEIIFNSKNIFMGNKKLDLTNQLIIEIDNRT